MTQFGSSGPMQAKPQANVYTVLLIIAILALGIGVGMVANYLMAPVADGKGYGLSVGELFEPVKQVVTGGR